MTHQACANCGAPSAVAFKGETFRVSHKGVSAEVKGLSGGGVVPPVGKLNLTREARNGMLLGGRTAFNVLAGAYRATVGDPPDTQEAWP